MIVDSHELDASAMSAFVPSEEWIDAYEDQATEQLYAKATRYAASRAAQIERAGGRIDDLYVATVVQDAFVDTWTGRLAWDPARAPLEQQVISAIRSRTRHDREHAMSRRHVSFDLHDPQRRAEVEASLTMERDASDRAAECGTRLLAELRVLAAADADVLALLDAYQDDVYEKRDIMNRAELSAKRYRNARHRLGSYVKQLPAEIQQLARIRA